MEEAKAIGDVMIRLPDEKDIPRLPKQFLINVVYTQCGDKFLQWVS